MTTIIHKNRRPGQRDRISSIGMDRFVEPLLAQTGQLAMIGKAERGPEAIRHSSVLAFEDLGMEAIHAFELRDFPVTVAIDARGGVVHRIQGVQPTAD